MIELERILLAVAVGTVVLGGAFTAISMYGVHNDSPDWKLIRIYSALFAGVGTAWMTIIIAEPPWSIWWLPFAISCAAGLYAAAIAAWVFPMGIRKARSLRKSYEDRQQRRN